MNMVQHFQLLISQGGISAFLIFLAGFALCVLAMERIYFLFIRLSFDSAQSIDRVRECILNRNYTQAVLLCNQEPVNPEMIVIKAGLMSAESGREAMKAAIGSAILKVSHMCEKRLSYLALIASAGTLLGLLGTISGLITTFAGIASADALEKGRLLGSGISEAMYSTAAGLVIGLVAMLVHTMCSSKVDSILNKVQNSGLSLITWIEHSERARNHG